MYSLPTIILYKIFSYLEFDLVFKIHPSFAYSIFKNSRRVIEVAIINRHYNMSTILYEHQRLTFEFDIEMCELAISKDCIELLKSVYTESMKLGYDKSKIKPGKEFLFYFKSVEYFKDILCKSYSSNSLNIIRWIDNDINFTDNDRELCSENYDKESCIFCNHTLESSIFKLIHKKKIGNECYRDVIDALSFSKNGLEISSWLLDNCNECVEKFGQELTISVIFVCISGYENNLSIIIKFYEKYSHLDIFSNFRVDILNEYYEQMREKCKENFGLRNISMEVYTDVGYYNCGTYDNFIIKLFNILHSHKIGECSHDLLRIALENKDYYLARYLIDRRCGCSDAVNIKNYINSSLQLGVCPYNSVKSINIGYLYQELVKDLRNMSILKLLNVYNMISVGFVEKFLRYHCYNSSDVDNNFIKYLFEALNEYGVVYCVICIKYIACENGISIKDWFTSSCFAEKLKVRHTEYICYKHNKCPTCELCPIHC